MRRNTNTTQTFEAVQSKALEQLLTVADVARILALGQDRRCKAYPAREAAGLD